MSDFAKNYGDFMDKLGAVTGPDLGTFVVNDDLEDIDLRTKIMVCARCKVTLNRFTGPSGEEEWVHSRAWLKFDHDPEPVEIDRPAYHEQDLLCDFCGRNQEVIWRYTGDRVQMASGNFGNDYGHAWAGCRACGEFVDAGDVAGLVQRVSTVSPAFSQAEPASRIFMMRQIFDLHTKFVPSIREKDYIGPPVRPARLNPRLMPKIQQGLLRFWTHPALYERLVKPGFNFSVPGLHVGVDRPETMDEFRVPFHGEDLSKDVFDRHAHHLANGIEFASLYWVSSNFTTLAVSAGLELKDFSLTREELPSPRGLVIWEDPIGEIPRPYGVAAIRAMSWVLVPEGVWINAYIQGEDADPNQTDVAGMRSEWGWLLCPNLGAGLPFLAIGGVDDNFRRDGNFLLTLLATWFLMTQPGVASETVAPIDKKAARAARRSGTKLPDVRVIDLRRHARPRHEPAEQAAEGRKVTVRFMVQGHWRRQAYGPKRGLRKTIYVAPFLKGPDGAPLKVDPPTVRVLR